MPLSHIVMHLALCNSVVRQDARRDVPVRVVLTDKLDRTAFDQKFKIEQGTTREAPIEFDIPFGVYRADIATPTCSAVRYMSVLPNVNRGVDVSLEEGKVQNPPVPAIVQGTAPFEFSYVQPTVMLFPRGLKCNDPIGDPLNVPLSMENEPDSYYATILASPVLEQNAPITVVVRLNDSHGGYQYVRVPMSDSVGLHTRWPAIGTVTISEGFIDEIAGKPEDTLICIHFLKTTESG